MHKLETVFVTRIEKTGLVVVRAETYHNWHTGDLAKRNLVFVRFTVTPHKSRLVLHKVVL